MFLFYFLDFAGRLQGVIDHRHPIHSPKPCAQAGAVHAAAAGHGKGGSAAAAAAVTACTGGTSPASPLC